MLRVGFPFLLLLVASLAHAQGPEPTPEELPPDWKAYTEAVRIADPVERRERLEEVVKAHPDTPGMLASLEAILETTAVHWPERTEEIMKLARRFVGAAPPGARIFAVDAAARVLLEAGVLLSEAEELAHLALAEIGGAESEEPEQLARRAPYLATLGRVLAAQGRSEEAEGLLKLAWAANPTVVAAPLALADLAEARGDAEAALGHLVAAHLTGRDPGHTTPRLEALYRGLNAGSLEGLEEQLDLEYRRLFPNPIAAERWIPADGGTGRILLLEVFTGTGCAPCVAMSLSVEAAIRRYGRENLTVLSYHRHIPVVDPFSNVAAEARAAEYDLVTIPAVAVDGRVIRGGGTRDETDRYWSYFSRAIEERLAVPPEAEIDLDVRREGDRIEAEARVRASGGGGRTLRLGLALVEWASYSGESGIRFHPAIARSLVFEDLPDPDSVVRHVFDLLELTRFLVQQREALEARGMRYPIRRDHIDPERVRVVAFVQDVETRAVLQSRAARPRRGPAPESLDGPSREPR